MLNNAASLVSGLPENPDLSLLELFRRISEAVTSAEYNGGSHAKILLAVVDAWYKKYGSLTQWKRPNFVSELSDNDRIQHLIKSVKLYSLDVEIAATAAEVERILDVEGKIRDRETFGIAILSDENKDKIRNHIENIRKIISESNIVDRKRLALLQRLALLEKELESVGTSTDRFFAFMGDAGFAMGDFANKAKPFIHEVKEIMKIVFQGREDAEGVRLPRRGDDWLLPPPEEQ